MDLTQVKALVRDVPDFPQEGIVFKDQHVERHEDQTAG
jgi:hypothetical protein